MSIPSTSRRPIFTATASGRWGLGVSTLRKLRRGHQSRRRQADKRNLAALPDGAVEEVRRG